MADFTCRTSVMFQHCDPAGLVFYPRYFEMMNAVVEHFFAEVVGWSFAEMHGSAGVGVPMGRISTEFHAASRLGDVLDWRLSVQRIGTASLDLSLRAECDGAARVSAEATLVLVDLARLRSTPWPEARRARLASCREELP